MLEKLQHCNCIDKHEKDTLIRALETAKVDAEMILIDTERGKIRVGKPPAEVIEDMERLIGDYTSLRSKVDNTPIC